MTMKNGIEFVDMPMLFRYNAVLVEIVSRRTNYDLEYRCRLKH